MIVTTKRRGRPKGTKPPESKAITYQRAMLKNEKEGGVRLNSILRGEDVQALERFRDDLALPKSMSYAQIMKIMIVLLDGKEFQRSGYTVTATLEKKEKMPIPGDSATNQNLSGV